jgi:hypothetical protein
MYITLQQAKKHLNLDDLFIDDDDYIASLISVAEAAVELHINQPLTGLTTNFNVGGETVNVLPAPICQAALLMIGNLYANREMVSFSMKTLEIPFNYRYLLDFYKNYSN